VPHKLRTRSAFVLRLAAVLLLGVAMAGPAEAQTGFVVEDLGALPGDASSVAWAINAQGDVVGWSNGPAGTRAFLFTDAGGLTALPGLPDRPRTVARDINDAGEIVGSANAGGADLGHAVLWSGGTVADLGTLGTGAYSEAWGINNTGQVVGYSYTNGGGFPYHAFLYTPSAGLVDLTPDSDTGYATDVNDAGQVTGYKTAFGGYHAFRWQEGSFVDLGVLPGFAHSFGWAINASGRVAGSSSSATGNSERFVRSTDGDGLQDLGGVGEHNVARGINASGDVVGAKGQSASRAVLYTDAGGLQDLNTLIDPSRGWVLLAANDINDAGQIAGYGFNNFTGRTHAVRLQPATAVPQCSLHCLRSTDIALRARVQRRSLSINGRVTVEDENGTALPGALIAGRWTRPDGSNQDAYAWTNSSGAGAFSTTGPKGTYTLAVVNIVLSLHTFDPNHSVLLETLTVR
jgi:probable HAF family extracellular repeat protein